MDVQETKSSKEAGLLLSQQLRSFKDTDAVVVAASESSSVIAHALADALHLPVTCLPCARIKHPAVESKSIGSVSLDDVVIDVLEHDIPQDYVGHQIVVMRSALKNTAKPYSINLNDRVVIVVHDAIHAVHDLAACLVSINKQRPREVVVASVMISPEAARQLASTVSALKYISLEKTGMIGHTFSQG